MEAIQLTIGLYEKRDKRGSLHNSRGRFATVAELLEDEQTRRVQEKIEEYRYTKSVSVRLRQMAERIIELEAKLKQYDKS